MKTNLSRRAFIRNLTVLSTSLLVPNLVLTKFASANTLVRGMQTPLRDTRLMLGTLVEISLRASTKNEAQEALELSFAKIGQLENILSRYKSSSALSILNSQGALQDCPPELYTVLEASNTFMRATEGAYNPSVAPLVDLYRSYQNLEGEIHIPSAELMAAQDLISSQPIALRAKAVRLEKSGQKLSLDGIAKGYIVDQVAELLRSKNIHNFLINAGGDVLAEGEYSPNKAWRVALQNPKSMGDYSQVLELKFGALASSGNYENYYDQAKKYHHIINPSLGISPSHVQNVSVQAPSAMQADALATAFSVLAVQKSLELTKNISGLKCYIMDHEQLWKV